MTNNIEMLQKVAIGLGDLKKDAVFVGGSVAELYVESLEASDIRPTIDIDCVVELSTPKDYYEFEKELRKQKFKNDRTPGAPICRWIFEDVIVDVMPIDTNILGFGNHWYKSGVENKVPKILPDGTQIYIFPSEYYLATKFEAIIGRGGSDLRISHDFEDVIYIMNNVEDIVGEIANNKNKSLKIYLRNQCSNLLNRINIEEEIECVLPFDSDHKIPIIYEILEQITQVEVL